VRYWCAVEVPFSVRPQEAIDHEAAAGWSRDTVMSSPDGGMSASSFLPIDGGRFVYVNIERGDVFEHSLRFARALGWMAVMPALERIGDGEGPNAVSRVSAERACERAT
jgi:hypothetical protein